MPDLIAADEAIGRFLTRTDRLITLTDRNGRRAARELLAVLAEADRSLAHRLELWTSLNGGGEMRFTEASMLVYREQMRVVTEFVEQRLLGLTSEQAFAASMIALKRTVALTRQLEFAFTGITVPLRVNEALIMRLQPSLLARHATSVDRYGQAMIAEMQRRMAEGLLEGVSQREMTNRLVAMRGPQGLVSLRAFEMQPGMVVRTQEAMIPEGLFVAKRFWAWRIVRTEVAEAQNATAQEEYYEAREELPDMQRKILAILDNRTAQDSLGVHGQVRALDKPFLDGAGRSYMRPPSRPNDRETLVPWRPHWSSTPRSRPLSASERERIWTRNERWQADRARRRARAKRG